MRNCNNVYILKYKARFVKRENAFICTGVS